MGSEWRDDRVAGLAAEVAFWAVLSLFPALLALTAAVGYLEPVAGADFADKARTEVVEWTERALAGDGGAIADQADELFDRRSAGLFTVGVLLALWTASRGFGALIRALDVVYDLEDQRTWVGVRTTALLLALGSVVVAVVVLALVLVGPLFGRGEDIADSLGLGDAFVTLWTWARIPVAIAILIAWATTVFHVAPNHRTPWRWDVPGALLTAVLWALGIVGFRFYVSVTSSGSNGVFGVLGGALTLMLWMYVTAVSVLLGGELNAELARRHGVEQMPSTEARVRRFGVRTARRLRSSWNEEDTEELAADDTEEHPAVTAEITDEHPVVPPGPATRGDP